MDAFRKRKREENPAVPECSNVKMAASSVSLSAESYDVIAIHQWLDGCGASGTTAAADGGGDTAAKRQMILPLVDLRSYDEFNVRHFDLVAMHNKTISSTKNGNQGLADVPIVNLPLSTLISGERSCELPPRHVEFAILIPKQYAQHFLNRDEDCSIHQLFFASQSKSTMQSRKPWLVRQVLIDDDSLWMNANEIGLVQCSKGGSNKDRGSMFPFLSLPRLWKPDPLIASDILPLLKAWLTQKDTDSTNSSDNRNASQSNPNNTITELPNRTSDGFVLDMGSGAGRDVCYLAEELKQSQHASLQQDDHYRQHMRSLHFIGIDNHKGSAKRCLPLWKVRGVDDITHSALLNLNTLHQVRDHLMNVSKLLTNPEGIKPAQQSTILCMYAIRFLNRRLLSYIASSITAGDESSLTTNDPPPAAHRPIKKSVHTPPSPLVLPVGTIFAISHFCKPNEGANWDFDHPKESSVLERRELKNMFTGDNTNGDNKHRWQILKDEIISDGDHGRTLIQFVVKKVA